MNDHSSFVFIAKGCREPKCPLVCQWTKQIWHSQSMEIPCGSDSEESARNAGDLGSVPGLGRSPGEGNGYPLQYSCLENPMDRGVWWVTIHGISESQTQLSDLCLTNQWNTAQQ